METTFQVSSDLFWGYRVTADLARFDGVDGIVAYVKADLRAFLLGRNLQMLADKLDACRFHVHSPQHDGYAELVEARRRDPRTVVYVCDHC
jgi:hypothetical protein